MKTLSVDLGDRSYPIFIGESLLSQSELYRPYIKGRQVLIVTNETVAPLYLAQVESALSDYQVDSVILPDGEQYKDLATLSKIYDALLQKQHNRTTTLIALGGGVVGDMTGYAAASYQRGVNFIQIPTTLLSQVDASVGGKTAVNHPLGKNMIGAFHQPMCVLADTTTLNTLEDRELSAGMAEVIKYGLIGDASFDQWLNQNMTDLMARDPHRLAEAIERSCRNKAELVAADEKEAGVRALLNLGHTFGHAIESHQGYGQWLHGEAVATGMLMAADLSTRMGLVSPEQLQHIRQLLVRANLPVVAPTNMTEADYIDRMRVDKKVLDGSIRLVLMRGIGDAFVTSDIDQSLLSQTLTAGQQLGQSINE